MTHKSVPTADFIRHFGRYHDEAQRTPITLTKHGRASLVVMSAEAYERLTQIEDPRRVYGPGETPPDLAEMLLTELDRQTAAYQAGQDE
jgi:prevent-host-death family protein